MVEETREGYVARIAPSPRLLAVPLAVALLAPAAAHGATLKPDHRCYYANEPSKGSRDVVTLTGHGFTPNGAVMVGADRPTADGNGAFVERFPSPKIKGLGARVPYKAVDESNPAIAASTSVLFTKLDVKLVPGDFNPFRSVRVRARGFMEGKYLYAHVRRGKRYRKTVRVGRVKTCGKVSKRKRLFSRSAGNGRYRVQFDNKRRYSARTRPASRFNVRIGGVGKSGASAAAAARR